MLYEVITSKWRSDGSVIDSRLNVNRRGKVRLDAIGYYEPSSGALNFNANADSVSLIVLETFIGGSLTNFQGYVITSYSIHYTKLYEVRCQWKVLILYMARISMYSFRKLTGKK